MKKVYKFIAAVSFSLLTIGASAQSPVIRKMKPMPISSTNRYAHAAPHNNTKKTTGTSQDALLDYVVGDQIFGGSFNYWSGDYLAVNAAYTIADSGASQNLLSNYATVTFDTVFDLYANTFLSPITPGSVVVDTIAAEIFYHNTSNKNDTIIFTINGVNASGFNAPATVYGIDTAIITPGFFSASSNTLDSIQFIEVMKSVSIPASARKGYNFAVNMTVHGPKTDTIAVNYYSQGTSACAAVGGYYTPAATNIGVDDGAQRNVNSFATGLYWENAKGQHGTNVSMTWPLTATGKTQGFCQDGGGYYSSPLALADVGITTCPGDTIWWSVQDIAIYPSISFVPAGVSELTANGLSVGQNYPNPANGMTEINYSLTKSSDVVFTVNDITGREIMNTTYSEVAPGQHVINLSANQFSAGVYFYTFKVNGNAVTKKMVISK